MFHPGSAYFYHCLSKLQLHVGCGKTKGTGFLSLVDPCPASAFRADSSNPRLQGESGGFPLEDRA
jgi:hypothetical protein